MLSSISTPRPRPPARRSSSVIVPSPPPPYTTNSHTQRNQSLGNLSELSELLVKADGLIKERELEIDNTSFTCKSLYENSVAIKSKHHALLARISTPLASPVSSPRSPTAPSFSKRTLKISQADISALYDDNAALIQKLEALESEHSQESAQASRALRKLEGEISALRDELALVTAKSEELERRAQDEERKLNRQKRDQRVLATRLGSRKEEPPVPNFAPPSIFSRSVSAPSADIPSSPAEQALASQLLDKIAELEATNATIRAKQEETSERLRSVQRETESISRAYECLSNPDGQFELEFVPDNEELCTPANKSRTTTGTVRFRSLRKSLDLSMFSALANDNSFDQGIERDMQSTVREDILPNSLKQQYHKGRPSVVGLFDPPSPSPGRILHIPSPALSILSLPEQEPTPVLRSLQSELGDAWPTSPVVSHTRNNSLYETLFGSMPDSPKIATEPDKHLDPNSVMATHAARCRRTSQTIRMKHSRLAGERHEPAPAEKQTILRRKFSRVFDAVVDKLLEPAETDSAEPHEPQDEPVVPAPKQPMEQKTGTLSGILLEVWLWLQFAIIVLVFLWAMARKGPREILQEADRRRLGGHLTK